MMVVLDSVLWHDDKKTANKSLKHRLEASGARIRESDKEPFIPTGGRTPPGRRFIVDNKIVQDRPTAGTEFAFEATETDDVRVIVYSSFIEREYKEVGVVVPDVNRRSAILFAPKPHVGVANPDEFERELAKIFVKFLGDPWSEVKEIKLPVPREALPEGSLSYNEFEQFSLKEKRHIYDFFRTAVEADLEAKFADGAIWIFYAGPSKEPYKIAYDHNEVMPADEVARLCSSLNCVPYIFRRDVRIDSTGCNTTDLRSGNPASLEFYPFANITFSTTSGAFRMAAHLDTGADYTVISDCFLDEQEIPIRSRRTFGSLRLQGRNHQVDEAVVDVILDNGDFEPSRNAKFSKEVRFLAIDDWASCSLMVHCGRSCRRKHEGSACELREHGLLGRTLYLGNESFDLFLNSETSRVNFVRRDRHER